MRDAGMAGCWESSHDASAPSGHHIGNKTRSPIDLSFAPDGSVAVANLADQRVHVWDSDLQYQWGTDALTPPGNVPAMPSITLLSPTLVAVHWLGYVSRTQQVHFFGEGGESLPTIQLFDRVEGALPPLAYLDVYPEVEDLNLWLNKGRLFRHESGLWFARLIDGRVYSFVSGGRALALRTPQLIRPRRPFELVDPTNGKTVGTLVDFQLLDIAPIGNHGFVALQAIAFPQGDEVFQAGYRAKIVLTALDSGGRLLGEIQFGEDPLRIAAGGGRVAVLASTRDGPAVALFSPPYFDLQGEDRCDDR